MRLLKGAADAVAHLHQKGIVTGGLSLNTSRVVEAAIDQRPQLILSPLGLTTLSDVAALVWDETAMETETDLLPGSDSSMSPNGKSDVYLLASILREMMRCVRNHEMSELETVDLGVAPSQVLDASFRRCDQLVQRAINDEAPDAIESVPSFIAALDQIAMPELQ